MRNGTLLGLSFILAIVIDYVVRGILSYNGYSLSIIIVYIVHGILGYTGSSSSIVSLVSSRLVTSFMIAPVLMIILVPINNKILKWRKERGRDIEEEQKYETEGGFISLSRRDDGD
ncbi:MAG: hypothetical protein WBD27_04425 [Pyrinomonadaceae bacterium]